jgi:hypothetical protein
MGAPSHTPKLACLFLLQDALADELPNVNWVAFGGLSIRKLHFSMPCLQKLPADIDLPQCLRTLSFSGCCNLAELPDTLYDTANEDYTRLYCLTVSL